jgi:hypothetical protein
MDDPPWTIEPGTRKLLSTAKLQPEHFHAIARALGVEAIRARKIGYVAARRATRRVKVETRWDGKETINTAQRGDWIVTNVSSQGEVMRDREGHENRYVIEAERFSELYEAATGGPAGDARTPGRAVYRAKGVVSALRLPGGFDIVAPWGERQAAPAGYLILSGPDVYGNNAETFAATYEEVRG